MSDITVPSSVQVLEPLHNLVISKPFFRHPFNESSITTNAKASSSNSSAPQPFIALDPSFLSLLGASPSVRTLAKSETGQSFAHEAGVYVTATNEVWFTSNLIREPPENCEQQLANVRVDISAVDVSTGNVRCVEVPGVHRGNGACAYGKDILFCEQGGDHSQPSQLVLVNPVDPCAARVLLNNVHGRHFNSINDVVILPPPSPVYSDEAKASEPSSLPSGSTVWFTDPPYGFEQGFRPPCQLPPHVYVLNPQTGHIRVVADGFKHPNGICFSPDRRVCYVTDTSHIHGSGILDAKLESTIYAYDVVWLGQGESAGGPSLQNRRVFAFADTGVPDGVKCDNEGNVYAGCGDGLHIWNQYGTLIGKIVLGLVDDNLGAGCANFCFAPDGKLVCFAEDRIYLVEGLSVEGDAPHATSE